MPTRPPLVGAFLNAANAWLCDGYHSDIRYIAELSGGQAAITTASLSFSPLPPPSDNNFCVEAQDFAIGQIQRSGQTKIELIAEVKAALDGIIEVPPHRLSLPSEFDYAYDSNYLRRDLWFFSLDIEIRGKPLNAIPTHQLLARDTVLRQNALPFDGYSDASNWLGLRDLTSTPGPPSIRISVSPPVDVIFEETSLDSDRLSIMIHAHPGVDPASISLAVRAVPGDGLRSRHQVSRAIEWERGDAHRKVGRLKLSVSNADSALVLLSLGGQTVRRQWFTDPNRARNTRLIAIQQFDPNLKSLRNALSTTTESRAFEKGIALLFFLLGFSPGPQIESDAPDLVVMTPGGRTAVVECTTRIGDFAVKAGKLIERRLQLSKALSDSGHLADVAAILVCKQSKAEFLADTNVLATQMIVLITQEDIERALEVGRIPISPDAFLSEALKRIGGSDKEGANPA